jgi:hypothetical protein
MGRQRTPAELMGTPLLDAVADVLLFLPHRWQPKDDHKKRKLRRLGADGRVTPEALGFIDKTARAITDEFTIKVPATIADAVAGTGPNKINEPQDPVERACLLAAISYLATLGGAPFHDPLFGAGVGHHLKNAMSAAQRHEAAEAGKSGGREWGSDNEEINAIITYVILANPGKTDAELRESAYAAVRHLVPRETTDKALLERMRRCRKKLSGK